MSPHSLLAYLFMMSSVILGVFLFYWPGAVGMAVLAVFAGVKGFYDQGDFWALMSAFIGLIMIFISIVILLY